MRPAGLASGDPISSRTSRAAPTRPIDARPLAPTETPSALPPSSPGLRHHLNSSTGRCEPMKLPALWAVHTEDDAGIPAPWFYELDVEGWGTEQGVPTVG